MFMLNRIFFKWSLTIRSGKLKKLGPSNSVGEFERDLCHPSRLRSRLRVDSKGGFRCRRRHTNYFHRAEGRTFSHLTLRSRGSSVVASLPWKLVSSASLSGIRRPRRELTDANAICPLPRPVVQPITLASPGASTGWQKPRTRCDVDGLDSIWFLLSHKNKIGRNLEGL